MEKFSPSQLESETQETKAVDFRSRSIEAVEAPKTEEKEPAGDHDALKDLVSRGFSVPDGVKYELGLNGGQNGNQSNN